MPKSSSLSGLTYYIHAFGCQMNKADSERICGMLDSCGCYQVGRIQDSDITIMLTCCVREAADTRLFGQLQTCKNYPLKKASVLKKRIFVLGGCIAQRDGERLLEDLDFLDIVIGTQTLSKLPDLLEDCVLSGKRSSFTPEESSEFSTDLPSKRESPFSAWLPITSGCNNFCTYCIVPYVRGREKSRPMQEIIDEAKSLVSDGVKEITLLGQNVNSYGRDLYGSPKFYEVLKQVSETGVPRLRFLTSHPKDLSDDVISLFSTQKNLMPAIHLPLQSGSDRVLKAMNRKYNSDDYLALIDKLNEACPGIAISTDIIVGFPGEDKDDFKRTLEVSEKSKYASAFTFIYSKREGTPAAKIEDNTPKEVIQKRFDELTDLIANSAYKFNEPYKGREIKVLVEGVSKKSERVARSISEHSQVIHFDLPEGKTIDDYVGQIINVVVEEPKTWYLKARIA
jgi:tRNA-2-methylthio-N6-dimethylallyladenosine synthase